MTPPSPPRPGVWNWNGEAMSSSPLGRRLWERATRTSPPRSVQGSVTMRPCCTAEAERHPCSQNLAQRGRDAESDRKSEAWATVNGITVG